MIGIIGPMLSEVEHYISIMKDRIDCHILGIPFNTGTIHGNHVVVGQCGVGKVNAAKCAQTMIHVFKVKCIILNGVAGALDPSLRVGDVVVASACIQHDVDAEPLGLLPGQLPLEDVYVYRCDRRLISMFHGMANMVGIIVSGDQFIASEHDVTRLRHTFNAMAVEMEGGAVGQVCHDANIPYVNVRAISDLANRGAPHTFDDSEADAAYRVFVIVAEALRSKCPSIVN